MSIKLEETRERPVYDVVLDIGDLRSLLRLMTELIAAAGNEYHLRIQAVTPDRARYETLDTGFFDAGGIADDKGVRAVTLVARRTDGVPGEVSVNLVHGARSRTNRFLVSGVDSTWVAGSYRRLDEFFGQVEQQRRLTKGQRRAIVAVVTGALLTLAAMVALFGFKYGSGPEPLGVTDENGKPIIYDNVHPIRATAFTFTTILLIASSYPVAETLRDWVDELWPAIEFRSGRHHVTVEHRRRATVRALLVLGVLPFLVSIAASVVLLGRV